MSNTDSFVEEVTEEVRRDRLFGLMRRYGWIAITLVVLLVGGAAYNEWQKARTQAAAQAFGDGILAALEKNDPAQRRAALADVATATPRQQALVSMFMAQEAEQDSSDVTTSLAALADEADLPQIYRELALLKFVMRADSGLTPDDKISRLTPLTIPGAPYRLLALEQIALAEVEKGESDAALTRLQGILAEDQVSQGLRRRVSQLIIALGGTLDDAA
ncbi:hypothetical protein [Oceaniglobus ichthyenteri]|uniref:hypothetical protein n=1 Tax=Oceaniglobus ichthyenteri TaxID=2136177 RepID=UPI000D3A2539|nr:hypothetical protein [Oceaniglobus ichthyenteri]